MLFVHSEFSFRASEGIIFNHYKEVISYRHLERNKVHNVSIESDLS